MKVKITTNYSKPQNIPTGVHWGSVQGTLLFLLNDLPNDIKSSKETP